MGWQDLLRYKESETFVYPWTGERRVQLGQRVWTTIPPRPEEHGWHEFTNKGSHLFAGRPSEPRPDILDPRYNLNGYLVGNRLVPDHVRPSDDPVALAARWNVVHLVDPGLERFSRINVGRTWEEGPLIYIQPGWPTGPEGDVARAYEDRLPNVNGIKGVTPALDAAFRFESQLRIEEEQRRKELEKRRREEEERRVREARRAELAQALGTSEGRRAMARMDFGEAAKNALTLGGAVYLDHRTIGRGEYAIRYRHLGMRLECVCDENLRVVSSGICLNAHYDDPDFAAGVCGDTWLSLESLPAIVAQADREGKLVIYRHG